ncbi:MAG: hypothetical protein R6U44_00980 [Archaeoglobaceae archaeon]
MVIKISLLVLLLTVCLSCGCLHEEPQNAQDNPDSSEDPNAGPESVKSRLQPPTIGSESDSSSTDLENQEDSTSSATPNTTWHTESASSQKKLGWSPPEDERKAEENSTRNPSNEATVSTIQDFKVTSIDSE